MVLWIATSHQKYLTDIYFHHKKHVIQSQDKLKISVSNQGKGPMHSEAVVVTQYFWEHLLSLEFHKKN